MTIVNEVPPQLWCSRYKDLNEFRCNFTVIDSRFNKPNGGCWTSTFTPDNEWCSDWLRWCSLEMPEWITHNCYLVIPDNDVRVYKIDSFEDYDYLLNKYGYRVKKYGFIEHMIDWNKVAEDYDGVWLTKRGLDLLFDYFDTWDTESVVWFKNVFKDIIPLDDIDVNCKY